MPYHMTLRQMGNANQVRDFTFRHHQEDAHLDRPSISNRSRIMAMTRNIFRRKITCFYCGKQTLNPRADGKLATLFKCPHCESLNHFDEVDCFLWLLQRHQEQKLTTESSTRMAKSWTMCPKMHHPLRASPPGPSLPMSSQHQPSAHIAKRTSKS